MKQIKLFSIVLMATLVLSACGSSFSVGPQDGLTSSTESLPVATQLLIGTLKLDGTEQDITSEQATELLPLWQVYGDLLTSNTAAQEEIDGLVKQIQATLTNEQTQVIEDMNLTQQDVFALIQENGGGINQASQSSRSSSNQSSGAGFGPLDGGMPMDTPPDGMSMGDQSSSDGDSSQTVADQSPMSNGVPSTLVDTLVELLKSKAGL